MQAGAGVVLHAKPGDDVRAGQPLLTLHTDEPERFARAIDALEGAIDVGGPGRVAAPRARPRRRLGSRQRAPPGVGAPF